MTTKPKTILTYTTKTGRQTHQIRFRHGGKQTARTFDTYVDAERFGQLLGMLGPDAAMHQLDVETMQAGIPTLNEVAADHIAHLPVDTEPATISGYLRDWQAHYGRLLGHLPVNAVTRDRVTKATNAYATVPWQAHGRTGCYTRKTLENHRGFLSAVCQRAVREGLLQLNPCDKLGLPRGAESDVVEKVFLTLEEYEDLDTAFASDWRWSRYLPLVRTLFGTGMRWGEAVELRIGDLRLGGANPYMRITRALKAPAKGAPRLVGYPKTSKSNRKVYLSAESVVDLAAAIDGRSDASALVFLAPRGGRVHHGTFWRKAWQPALEAADMLDPRPRIHDLRHSHISHLIDVETPIEVVQDRVGHERIETTMRYLHLTDAARMRAVHAAALSFRRAALPKAIAS